MNIVWPFTAWYLGPLALWTYWHIGHLNLVSQSRTGRKTTNIEVDIETGNTPHHVIEAHKNKNGNEKPFWETWDLRHLC